MGSVKFTVIGVPSQQAGMRSVPIKTKSGKQFTRQITTGGKNLKSWRAEVSDAAMAEVERVGCMHGPLYVRMEFRFPMPKSRPKWMRDRGIAIKVSAPDTDKLIRAIGDSLTVAGLIPDDAPIADVRATKVEVWEAWTGVVIEIVQLDQLTMFGRPAPASIDGQGSLL